MKHRVMATSAALPAPNPTVDGRVTRFLMFSFVVLSILLPLRQWPGDALSDDQFRRNPDLPPRRLGAGEALSDDHFRRHPAVSLL
jgi:hypothetical protein